MPLKKITVKNLIEFRGKNDKTKLTYVRNLKQEKEKAKDASGGDYWISCLSAIRNFYRTNNADLLDKKIDFLREKIELNDLERIKNQFKRNISILESFKEFELNTLKPASEITILKQHKEEAIFKMDGLPVEV